LREIGKHLRGHFVAYLALFFALGGTSFAAVTALPKNSVGSPQIKNGSIQKVDISKRTVSALRGLRGLRGLTGATGATGTAGAQGPKGDTGATGSPGSALAYAHVNADGSLVAADSKNITAGNLYKSTLMTGVYCFKGLGFTPHNVVATPQINSAFGDRTIATVGLSEIAGGYCNDPATQIGVFMLATNSAARPDTEFFITIN
jgi:hypothetical protein